MVKEINAFLTEASNQFDLSKLRIDAVMEAAVRELSINYEEAQLKVLKENGTADDLAYLYEEADNGLLETVIKAIEKIKDAIIKFFSDMSDKILEIFTKKENKEVVDKLEKKVKLLPLVGRKKIIIEDYSKQEKVVDEHMGMLKKLKAKFISGQKVETADVEEVSKSFKEKYAKAIGVAAAITVTVSAGIVIYRKYGDKLVAGVKERKNEIVGYLDSLKDNINNRVQNAHVAQSLADAASTIAKNAQQGLTQCTTGVLSAIKKAISGAGKTAVDVKSASKILGESTDDELTKDLSNNKESDLSEDGIAKEDGEFDDPIDAYNDEDPFEKVAQGLLDGLTDEELDSLDDSTDVEGDTDDEDDTFESYFDKFMADISSDDTVNESYEEEDNIDDLFNSIYESVMNREDEATTESVADQLYARILALK